MLSLKSFSGSEYEKKQGNKIDKELPYFITLITLLATSGLGPYTILKKIVDINLLPTIKAESSKIIKRIDMLGIDPLKALSQAKERPSSKALGEFLGGYVSAIQSGGNVISYLKSKMFSSYEMLESREKQSIEKISGIVHAYLTVQIVILAVFILIAAVGSSPLTVLMGNGVQTSSDPPFMLLAIPPIISVAFMKIAQYLNKANIGEVEVKKLIRYGLPPILAAVILVITNVLSSLHINAYILGSGLVAASIWPTIRFNKMYKANLDAETSTPQILRDITEARKAGIGPEKCIIHACKRKDFDTFTPIANGISNKLEWGIPLSNIFDTIQNEIKNFQVLISFRILFEIIFSGGGNVNTLDTLADTSEKIQNIEKTKREMLKPYIIVGFMLVSITGFTTILTIQSFSDINEQKSIGHSTLGQNDKAKPGETNSFIELVSVAIILQAWLAGLFIGKITKGAFSGGFLFSILLTVITMITIMSIQSHIVNLGSIIKSPT